MEGLSTIGNNGVGTTMFKFVILNLIWYPSIKKSIFNFTKTTVNQNKQLNHVLVVK
jgi:hypothetical protein